jgi:hypothetical protein
MNTTKDQIKHSTATNGKPPVSGSIKKLDHYCRRRDCQFHKGIKDECVLCSHPRADVQSDKDGMLRCFSYCR